jgi:hypothetical protein
MFQQDHDDFDTFDCQLPDDVHALFSADMEKYSLIKEAYFFQHQQCFLEQLNFSDEC